MGCCIRGVAENFYHFFIWGDNDEGVPLVGRVPNISSGVQSDTICPFKERMGDMDVVKTEGVLSKNVIAARLIIFGTAVGLEFYLPDCAACCIGNKEVTGVVEGQAVGHEWLRDSCA
jgi:hypothetical protein